jgi:signal transduction histidine kinase
MLMNETITDSKITSVPCPNCGEALPKDAKTCPNCGVDLLLMTLLTERSYLDGLPGAAPISAAPETLIPRIGDYLLDHGLITEEQLESAVEQQKLLAENKDHRLLGQTLIEMDYIDAETLDLAINLQIIELHTALREANRTLEQRVEERTVELKSALERLSEANQIKANLISNISHELRTPLAHIKGYVELIRDEDLGVLTDDQKDAIHVMQRSTLRLESLIDDLIEFSTAARGGITLNIESVNITNLAKSVLSQSLKKADKGEVKLKIALEEHLPNLNADPARLEWALYQLVDNGIKFTPDGGKVNIQVGIKDLGIHFIVSDTGIGIPEDRIHEIFEPFHQLDGSPTRRYGGAGLGLALVKIIVDAHGAKLSVKSQEGKGTKFEFTIPSVSGNK